MIDVCKNCNKQQEPEWGECIYCETLVDHKIGDQEIKLTGKMIKVGDFKIGKYTVTFVQYDHYCNEAGKEKPEDQNGGRGNRPVINVSWYDALAYCEWLSKKTGKRFRLPTESEWEYAAKGGKSSRGYKYSGSNNFDEVGWHEENSGEMLQPVGIKKGNELGIHDMSGNVWEWCEDWFDIDKDSKILRGGSWLSDESDRTVKGRFNFYPKFGTTSFGFRLAQD